jgi:DNA polymerase III epsilon subunit-like protein
MVLDRYLVVDIEATSDEPSVAELLTGSFRYCDRDFNTLDQYNLKCRPRKWDAKADEAVRIHGIEYPVAMSFPLHAKAVSELSQWLNRLDRAHFVCHANRRIFKKAGELSTYDYTVLSLAFFDYGMHFLMRSKLPVQSIISTHSLAKYLQLGCDYDLKSLSQFLRVELTSHHVASADEEACYGILKELIPRVDLERFLDYENFLIKEEVENEDDTRATKAVKRKPRKTSGDFTGLIP